MLHSKLRNQLPIVTLHLSLFSFRIFPLVKNSFSLLQITTCKHFLVVGQLGYYSREGAIKNTVSIKVLLEQINILLLSFHAMKQMCEFLEGNRFHAQFLDLFRHDTEITLENTTKCGRCLTLRLPK